MEQELNEEVELKLNELVSLQVERNIPFQVLLSSQQNKQVLVVVGH